MSYQLLKFWFIYFQFYASMYGLSCFNFDNVLLKAKATTVLLFILLHHLVSLGYLFGSFILDFVQFIFDL